MKEKLYRMARRVLMADVTGLWQEVDLGWVRCKV